MQKKIISVAQIENIRKNIDENIRKHIYLSKIASDNGANIIIFPEMSLTGYEREYAESQSFNLDDNRFEVLQKLSINYKIIIVIGVPLKIANKMYIASIIFMPDKNKEVYIKKFLHDGEEKYFFCRNDYDPILKFKNEKITFAICYDIEKDEHIEFAVKRNASMYIASIFYPASSINKGIKRLQDISRKYSIAVIMSNYIGNCWDREAGGKSSIWSKNGRLVISSSLKQESLLLAENNFEQWKIKEIKI